MIDKNQYILEKYIYLLIFGDTCGDYKEQTWITNMDTLFSLKVVLQEFVKYNHLSFELRDKLYKILSASREIKTDDYNERIDLINEIISLLNSELFDESEYFYRNEMCKRYSDNRYYSFRLNIDGAIPEINDSIAFDFILLQTHFNESNEIFEEAIESFSDTPHLYYLSLNAILYENPELFKDEKFKERVFQVLNSISEKNNNKKTTKRNKNIIKYLSKMN